MRSLCVHKEVSAACVVCVCCVAVCSRRGTYLSTKASDNIIGASGEDQHSGERRGKEGAYRQGKKSG